MNTIPAIANSTQAKPVDKQDAKLRKTCQDFEALLVTQMLSAMRQTITKNDVFGSREKEEIFQGMLDEETAIQMSRSGNLKLADLLYAEFSTADKRDSGADQSSPKSWRR